MPRRKTIASSTLSCVSFAQTEMMMRALQQRHAIIVNTTTCTVRTRISMTSG